MDSESRTCASLALIALNVPPYTVSKQKASDSICIESLAEWFLLI